MAKRAFTHFLAKGALLAASWMTYTPAIAAAATLAIGADGGPLCSEWGCWSGSSIRGTATLSFSTMTVGAMNTAGFGLEQITPGIVSFTRHANGLYRSASVTVPVVSLSGTARAGFEADAVTMVGGARLTTEVDPDGFASTGGFIQIQSLRADLAQRRVHATLVGGHGVGVVEGVHLWNVSNIEGALEVPSRPLSDLAQPDFDLSTTLTGLSFTPEAAGIFAQALGLNETGVAILGVIHDFGRIDLRVTTVPEPSTHLFMGIGLAGLAAAAARQRRVSA